MKSLFPTPNSTALAIDDERAGAILQRRLDDQRISIRPVMAIVREQPDALVILLDDQPIAVMLDFVNPVGASRNASGAGRDAGLVLSRAVGGQLFQPDNETLATPDLNVVTIYKLLGRGDSIVIVNANQRLVSDEMSIGSDDVHSIFDHANTQGKIPPDCTDLAGLRGMKPFPRRHGLR
jgi:hypothetical protein